MGLLLEIIKIAGPPILGALFNSRAQRKADKAADRRTAMSRLTGTMSGRQQPQGSYSQSGGSALGQMLTSTQLQEILSKLGQLPPKGRAPNPYAFGNPYGVDPYGQGSAGGSAGVPSWFNK